MNGPKTMENFQNFERASSIKIKHVKCVHIANFEVLGPGLHFAMHFQLFSKIQFSINSIKIPFENFIRLSLTH